MARFSPAISAAAVDGTDSRDLAGVTLAVGGILVTGGITVAGTLDLGYSIHAQTISELGATESYSELLEPAGAVFTLSMALSGMLVAVAGALGRPALDDRVTGGLIATGLGIFGVAVFPLLVGWPHALAALIAFVGGGVTALLAAWTTRETIRWLSATLGAVSLLALVAFLTLGGDTPLGIGGLERLVSLPIQCWAILFGGWLLGDPGASTPH